MKRVTLILAFAAMVIAAYAQPRAIGLRLGSGFEFSYEHGLHSVNMISIDAGLCHLNGVEVAVTHDWINPGGASFANVWNGKGEWNWYAGVGGALGFYWPHSNYDHGAFVGVAGRIGVEYNFWFPLQLSVDYRPVIGVNFLNESATFYRCGLYAGGLTLGVRYHF